MSGGRRQRPRPGGRSRAPGQGAEAASWALPQGVRSLSRGGRSRAPGGGPMAATRSGGPKPLPGPGGRGSVLGFAPGSTLPGWVTAEPVPEPPLIREGSWGTQTPPAPTWATHPPGRGWAEGVGVDPPPSWGHRAMRVPSAPLMRGGLFAAPRCLRHGDPAALPCRRGGRVGRRRRSNTASCSRGRNRFARGGGGGGGSLVAESDVLLAVTAPASDRRLFLLLRSRRRTSGVGLGKSPTYASMRSAARRSCAALAS